MKKPAEKRRHRRVSPPTVDVEIYSFVGDTMSSEKFIITDISKGGLCFSTDHTFMKGRVLRLTFNIPNTRNTVRTNAIVIHNSERNGMLFTGVQFKGLAMAETRLIENYVKSVVQEQKTD